MLENISNFFIGILLFLDGLIYSLISWVYQIILVICQVDILDNSYEIDALINRIYVIIGVVVLFLVAYSLLKSMVNPDDVLKNKKGPVNIIKDIIISIALIALVPTIFSFATRFQTAILMENTIGKVILGTSSNETGETSEETIEDGGIAIAANLLQAFLHPNYDLCTKNDDYTYDCSNVEVATKNTIGWIPIVSFFINVNGGYNNFDSIWESILETGNFLSISSFAYSISHESNITYYYIISTVAGAFTLFVLLSYCIDVAIRTIKLAVYQLIAPLPILSRIIPGEQGNKVFSNWIKATISTYVEVFIRLAILFFAILLIKLVIQNLPTLLIGGGFISGNASFTVYLFAQVFIIIGIILFIKQAPQLLKDITGLDSGKYGKSLIRGIGMMGATFGGGATAAIRRAVTDKKEHPEMGKGQRFGRALSALGGGMRRGLWQGSKTEKLGDIPKAAGRTASNTLAHQSNVEAAGGNWKYYSQKKDDMIKGIFDWAGGTAEGIKAEKAVNDKLLKVVSSVKAIAEDYVDKHAHEFTYLKGMNDSEKSDLKYLQENLKKAQESGNEEDIQAANQLMNEFNNRMNQKYRLDILKAKSTDTNLSSEERAEYVRLYNDARKYSVDNFATTAHSKEGAEKEAAQIKAQMEIMSQTIKENASSIAVQNLVSGNDKYDLEKYTKELTTDTAAEYFKKIKAATEYANIDIEAKMNEIEQREQRKKASSGGKDKK